ncbi:MAG TPA: serine protease [Chromatiaceae bacterium]|jgi:hypothetical protein|nr:MAG: hypothetical protein N838_14385 [Thiohalocapsa sp. PB-PSB1]QQO54523.1 MAG: trypsin-like peptidase domain-containing protein [Thiohalocapsa sp. PB-PSB1]HBG96229.1 serine protease [Chromatiaceae bacterium]HCS89989.1 serine protease [Chromatiaceae bacterium]
MDRFYQPSSIRILADDHSTVGTGIYVGEHLILTCEHVVASAQGRERASQERPVHFRFAFDTELPGAANPAAKVISLWPAYKFKQPGKLYDVALLEVSDPSLIPKSAAAAPLSEEIDRLRQQGELFGFANEAGRGVEVIFQTQGTDGLVQLDWGRGEAAVAGGHSGSPVWNTKTRKVMGMVIEKDAESSPNAPPPKIAYMLPARLMNQALEEVRQERAYSQIRKEQEARVSDAERSLTDLLRKPLGDGDLTWPSLIEVSVRLFKRGLDSRPGPTALEQTAWLLQYTDARQPFAYGLLQLAQRRYRGSLNPNERFLRELEQVGEQLMKLYPYEDKALEKVRKKVGLEVAGTSLALRFQPTNESIFAVEAIRFWRWADGVKEQSDVLETNPKWVRLCGKAGSLATERELVDWIKAELTKPQFKHGVEVVLPPERLMDWDLAPEAWCDSKNWRLGNVKLVLRSFKGFTEHNIKRQQHWDEVIALRFDCCATSATTLAIDDIEDLFADQDAERGAAAATSKVAVLDPACRAGEQLEILTSEGVSVVLWLRKPARCGTAAEQLLLVEIGDCNVVQLPLRLKELRKKHRRDPQEPRSRIGLLMDNPYRTRERRPSESPRSRAG